MSKQLQGGARMISLIFILTADEQDSLKSLYKNHNVIMYNIAFRMLKKPEEAEEAVQEAFLRIVKNIEKVLELPGPQKVSYCAIITKNISYNMLRRKKPLLVDIAYFDDFPADDSTDPQAELFAKADRELLAQSIDSLDSHDKDIILMRWGKKMHYKEIGEILGLKENTAAKRGQRALIRLKTIYMKRFDNGQ